MDDEIILPDLFDMTDADGDPTARGIVQCLRMLAEEAATLGLGRTLDALRTAITVCAGEGDADEREAIRCDMAVSRLPGTRLH